MTRSPSCRFKLVRLIDTAQLQNVRRELELLTASQAQSVGSSLRLAELASNLKTANAALWDIEDALRLCDRNGDFGPRFIELARSVYRHNDRRAALKRQINTLLGSPLVEEKF
jgi:hypothetical protein